MRLSRRFAGQAVLGLLMTAGIATSEDSTPFSFGVIGDMPFTSPTFLDGEARYMRLIAHMNSSNLAFGIHVGDIKSGSTLCSDSIYSRNLEFFNTFTIPILFTPGDNEWTDCHRTNNGNIAPLDRLALIRSTFFTTDYTLGVPAWTLKYPLLPENRVFLKDSVLVVTLNIPGSNNNREQKISELVAGVPRLNPYYDNDAEYTARNAANMFWLDAVLIAATYSPSIKGVVVAIQANPFERFLEPVSATNNNPYVRSGYEDFMTKLRARTLDLQRKGKKILLVHTDTHIQRIDQPLTDTYPGCDPAVTDRCVAVPVGGTTISNFTRAEGFATTNVHWTKVTVDPANPALFTIEPVRVPGN